MRHAHSMHRMHPMARFVASICSAHLFACLYWVVTYGAVITWPLEVKARSGLATLAAELLSRWIQVKP